MKAAITTLAITLTVSTVSQFALAKDKTPCDAICQQLQLSEQESLNDQNLEGKIAADKADRAKTNKNKGSKPKVATEAGLTNDVGASNYSPEMEKNIREISAIQDRIGTKGTVKQGQVGDLFDQALRLRDIAKRSNKDSALKNTAADSVKELLNKARRIEAEASK